jgi:hypothetical protein
VRPRLGAAEGCEWCAVLGALVGDGGRSAGLIWGLGMDEVLITGFEGKGFL